ncbi:1-phosphofructokinase family hexose kinase [Ectothiorhodospira shaposhnikovii]|uniref:1-phosphofructokinase family hexose kinase n=1 Tax=Ectothiorhodospira shaposhnikovii TaxID=1054 RepID=UPI001EE7DE6C|nr:1-phosphofructokinase family hexose kinase [Ectothiorhodospira shaposhnikovii]MCG5514169.1 1-phosphofructokinase family hexose kinase [Ectothiorhodospira shaposhnikovii]
MTKRIVTLTLNPAVDASCATDKVRPVHKIRTTNERMDPGGGGINVARVVNELGGQSFAVYLAGGRSGDVLDELVADAGVMAHRVHTRETTRVSHVVYEQSSGQEFRFTPEGPTVQPAEWKAALDFIELLDFDYVIASGSIPRGTPEDVYARLSVMTKRRGARMVLDTSGPALAAALEEGVYLAKPSRGEFAALMGRDLEDPRELEAAAREIVADGGVEILTVTLGHDGALLATRDGIAWLKTPEVTAKSAVGAGDSFVAGMTHGLSTGESISRAFALGVAAGTATVLTSGTELCHKSDVMHFWEMLTQQE